MWLYNSVKAAVWSSVPPEEPQSPPSPGGSPKVTRHPTTALHIVEEYFAALPVAPEEALQPDRFQWFQPEPAPPQAPIEGDLLDPTPYAKATAGVTRAIKKLLAKLTKTLTGHSLKSTLLDRHMEQIQLPIQLLAAKLADRPHTEFVRRIQELKLEPSVEEPLLAKAEQYWRGGDEPSLLRELHSLATPLGREVDIAIGILTVRNGAETRKRYKEHLTLIKSAIKLAIPLIRQELGDHFRFRQYDDKPQLQQVRFTQGSVGEKLGGLVEQLAQHALQKVKEPLFPPPLLEQLLGKLGPIAHKQLLVLCQNILRLDLSRMVEKQTKLIQDVLSDYLGAARLIHGRTKQPVNVADILEEIRQGRHYCRELHKHINLDAVQQDTDRDYLQQDLLPAIRKLLSPIDSSLAGPALDTIVAQLAASEIEKLTNPSYFNRLIITFISGQAPPLEASSRELFLESQKTLVTWVRKQIVDNLGKFALAAILDRATLLVRQLHEIMQSPALVKNLLFQLIDQQLLWLNQQSQADAGELLDKRNPAESKQELSRKRPILDEQSVYAITQLILKVGGLDGWSFASGLITGQIQKKLPQLPADPMVIITHAVLDSLSAKIATLPDG